MRRTVVLGLGLFSVLLVAPGGASAARTSVARLVPVYANGGQPDLTVDPQRLTAQMEIVDRRFSAGDCELEEGTVGGTGYRRLLRFDVVVINSGDGPLLVGNPEEPTNPYAPLFELSLCHRHYHLVGFADYQLRRPNGTVAATGHKQAFCLEDSLKYGRDPSDGYSCVDQGISSGWGDWYYKQLSGQWIDITGVAEGDYVVRVEVNAAGSFGEGQNRYANVIEAPVRVPDPRNKVAVDTAALDYGK